ncbi:dockerin [Telluria mixta]|uniref:Dockerin n=1 Tax=Telluria mixta TaxID=34071 RepID=A0ABT2C938_9BURK|nr:dockerin [Telluria mixta]MCS0633922.1 dockerin [Telluria mixta]WEM95536.1 dockerin [Telluria mixta]
MYRKHSIIISAALAALVAGCSGGDRTAGPSATAQAPAVAATVGSATSYTSVKWGGGGYVTGLIYHPTSYNVMYARTDVGGAYRWNGGGSWTPITDGIGFGGGDGAFHGVESIAVDPTNDNKVYLVTGIVSHDWQGTPINGRIYVSGDRGASWTHYDLPFPVGGNENARAIGERLKADPTNPSTLFYASRTAGLWKSTNSGQTWTQTGLSSKVLSASEIQGLGSSPVGVEQIMFDNSNVGGGATTWIMYAAIAPDYVQKAGLTSTMYKSVNGGASWTPVSVPSSVSGYYVPHMVRTSDGNYYVVFNKNAGQGAGGPGYLYRFGGVNFNESWTQLATTTQGGYGGVSVFGTGSTARIALAVTGTWSAGQPVVQLSDAGGAPGSWREIADGMQHWGGGFRGWVDDIEIDPTNKDHILHIHGGGVWETWNASAASPSWDAPVNNLEETATLALVTPPAGASYKFVNSAGDIGNWVQTDLAATPTRTPNSAWGNGDAADVLWSDPNYIVAAGIISGGSTVAYGSWSGDSGNSWSNFASLPAGASTNFADTVSIVTTSRNNIVWAPANSIPSWTSNNGASWTQVSGLPTPNGGLNNAYRLVVDRQSPNKVYAFDGGGAWWNSTTGKVYQSTDGGHSFALVQGSVAANFAPNDFGLTTMVGNPNASGDLWVTDGNAVYHSTNSGASWTKLSGFATVAASGSTGPLPGAARIALGKAQAGASYSAAVYVVGTRGGVWGIWHSDDGGATWARFNDDAHQYAGIGVIAADWSTYGRIYFSGNGRGVIYTN